RGAVRRHRARRHAALLDRDRGPPDHQLDHHGLHRGRDPAVDPPPLRGPRLPPASVLADTRRLGAVRSQAFLTSLSARSARSPARLEALSTRLAGMTGRLDPPLDHAVVFTLAADHGVAAEGVSAYPREVTAQMVLNFLRGGAAINVLARHLGARVVIADIGVDADIASHPNLRAVKVRRGTDSIPRGP